jgi:hypothetical protein
MLCNKSTFLLCALSANSTDIPLYFKYNITDGSIILVWQV